MRVAMLKRFRNDRRGATALEYALIGSLVFMVALAGMTALGHGTNTMYNTITAAITGSAS